MPGGQATRVADDTDMHRIALLAAPDRPARTNQRPDDRVAEGGAGLLPDGRIRGATPQRAQTRRRPNSYRAVLATPGACAFFAAAAATRIGLAMTSLGIVWLVHWRTGSYGAVGIVVGAFAVAEAGLCPQVARLIDRYGQTRALPFILAVHGLALGILVSMVVGGRPVGMLAVAGVLAGASSPQMGALTAARWSALLHGRPTLSAAFALEMLSTDLAFLIGPTLVGTANTLISPVAGTILAAALIVIGGMVFAAQRATAPPPPKMSQATGGRARMLLTPSFSILVSVSLGIGLFFGCLQVSVTAFTASHHAVGITGPLYSLVSGASLVAGLLYGRRRWQTSLPTQLISALGLLATGCLLAILADTPLWLAATLIISGLAIAPTLIISSVLTEALIDSAALVQAFGWMSSAGAVGVAAAAAVTGQAVDVLSARWGFGIALAAVALLTVAVCAGRSTLATSIERIS